MFLLRPPLQYPRSQFLEDEPHDGGHSGHGVEDGSLDQLEVAEEDGRAVVDQVVILGGRHQAFSSVTTMEIAGC